VTPGAEKRTVAVIPARYGSQRFPGKPLAMIAGKPMIVHVMERAAKARLVDGVIVATDDERIADAVRLHGGAAVMTPSDIRSGSDRIALAARDMAETEIIVNVQGDEPLIPPEMIDEAVRPLLEDRTIEAGTLVRRFRSVEEFGNPNIPKALLDRAGRCMYFSRAAVPFGRGIAPEVLIRTPPCMRMWGCTYFAGSFSWRSRHWSRRRSNLPNSSNNCGYSSTATRSMRSSQRMRASPSIRRGILNACGRRSKVYGLKAPQT
jgi:3-deoxy-D-manno-octulosonate cytidylyltransferase